jgi:hypothetical protein
VSHVYYAAYLGLAEKVGTEKVGVRALLSDIQILSAGLLTVGAGFGLHNGSHLVIQHINDDFCPFTGLIQQAQVGRIWKPILISLLDFLSKPYLIPAL